MRKIFSHVFKIAVTIGLLWYLIQKIDVEKSVSFIFSANPLFLLSAIVISGLALFFNAARWRKFLAMAGVSVSIRRVFICNLIGIFYGIVLPGGKLTGDVASVYRLVKSNNDGRFDSVYVSSVIADRFMGVLAIFSVLALCFLAGYGPSGVFGEGGVVLGWLAVVAVALSAVLVFTSALDFLRRFLDWPVKFWRSFVGSLFSSLEVFRKDKKGLLGAFFLSFIGVFFGALSVYFLSLAVGMDKDFLSVVFAYAFATALIVIPVTIGGVGLREGGLVYALVRLGVDASQAAALSFLMLAVFSLYALVGGLAELIFFIKNRGSGTAPNA